MATTIKSTGLDFESIKSNLKTFLASKEEFTDYNFEASGLSNILDVLAYNTHYNALTANYALNESFIGTAQLRSSLVSLSEGIGYIPDSRKSAVSKVKLNVNLSGQSNLPAKLTIASGFVFNSIIDGITYKFQTVAPLSAVNNGADIFFFKTADGIENIDLKEGVAKTKTFIAGPATENDVYIIPDKTLDLTTAIVKVYETSASTTFTTYESILTASAITSASTLYVLKESPNGYFELTFGNGTTLGKSPVAGNKIVVEYLSSSGADANNADVFTPVNQFSFSNNLGSTVNVDFNVTTVNNSSGGTEKESIESIRKNAPFQYAAQNRMVTAADYSSLILRNFSNYINDIKTWGGEDHDIPEFGSVYVSIDFISGLEAETIASIKRDIVELADQLSIISFKLKFKDPVKTYVSTDLVFQFNPSLSTLSLNTIQDNVRTTVGNYFANSVGKFEQSFRRSNLLTLVDAVSPAVLSSRSDVKMHQRLIPQVITTNDDNTTTTTSKLGVATDYIVRYPVNIDAPDDVNNKITSSTFTYLNRSCILRNRLRTNIIEIIDLSTNKPIIDNIGSYNVDGTLTLIGFAPESIAGGVSFIKIFAVPANQSAISPVRDSILQYDEQESSFRGNVVSST